MSLLVLPLVHHLVQQRFERFGKTVAAQVAPRDGDLRYSTSVGVAASVTNRTQMKIEVLNTYRTTPPVATIEKSDLSTLMSFVFKF